MYKLIPNKGIHFLNLILKILHSDWFKSEAWNSPTVACFRELNASVASQ